MRTSAGTDVVTKLTDHQLGEAQQAFLKMAGLQEVAIRHGDIQPEDCTFPSAYSPSGGVMALFAELKIAPEGWVEVLSSKDGSVTSFSSADVFFRKFDLARPQLADCLIRDEGGKWLVYINHSNGVGFRKLD
jgi:hypothetical protein